MQTGAFARHQSSAASPRSTASAAGVCLASESRSCITSGGNSRSGALPVLVARTSTRLAGAPLNELDAKAFAYTITARAV